MNDFRMRPAPELTTDADLHRMLGDEETARLVDRGFIAAANGEAQVVGADPHQAADMLFRKFKAGSAMLTKPEAYAIGNLIEAQARRIDELENGGRAYSAKSPDVGGAALPADVGRPACQLECLIHDYVRPVCEEHSAEHWACTRRAGHDGPHVACDDVQHDLASWAAPELPLPSREREIESAIDDDLHREAFVDGK